MGAYKGSPCAKGYAFSSYGDAMFITGQVASRGMLQQSANGAARAAPKTQ